NKYYKEICLNDQEFIKDSSVNVGTYVKNNGGEIVRFVRYGVGEGIEKKEENFAEEVMSQVNA
ncbi:MAG: elongation factor Ts, partial [Bacilli bacterium]|nr:elongation factor Ts [Bacilli bacterium]